MGAANNTDRHDGTEQRKSHRHQRESSHSVATPPRGQPDSRPAVPSELWDQSAMRTRFAEWRRSKAPEWDPRRYQMHRMKQTRLCRRSSTTRRRTGRRNRRRRCRIISLRSFGCLILSRRTRRRPAWHRRGTGRARGGVLRARDREPGATLSSVTGR